MESIMNTTTIGILCLAVLLAAAIIAALVRGFSKSRRPLQVTQVPPSNGTRKGGPAQDIIAEEMSTAPSTRPAEALTNPTPAYGREVRAALPPSCPACGSPVRPNEVKWLDGNVAECSYCGRILHGKLP
jgi:hypothetical protein